MNCTVKDLQDCALVFALAVGFMTRIHIYYNILKLAP